MAATKRPRVMTNKAILFSQPSMQNKSHSIFSTAKSIFSRVCKIGLSDISILILVAASIVIALSYIHVNDYSRLPFYLDLQMQTLDGNSVEFPDINNAGLTLLVYPMYKFSGLDPLLVLRLLQFSALVGCMLLFYDMTKSFKLSIAMLAYVPFLSNTIITDSSLAAFFILLAVWLYLKGSKTLAFLCAIPIQVFRHEGAVIFAGLLIYEFIQSDSYKSIKSSMAFMFSNFHRAGLVLTGVLIYMYFQHLFYGHYFANMMLNLQSTIDLSFGWHVYAIRYLMLIAMAVASVFLYSINKKLFVFNTSMALVYIYFGLFGFEYTLVATQVYYAWMFPFALIILSYYAGILPRNSLVLRTSECSGKQSN